MYPENPNETRVIVGSMNTGYDKHQSWHYQDSNSQPVSSQMRVDSTRSRRRIWILILKWAFACFENRFWSGGEFHALAEATE